MGERPSPAELAASPDSTLVATFEHAQLIEFVVEWFFRRRSWVTVAHHAMSAATFLAIVGVAIARGQRFLACVGDFALALVALVLVVLPLHELLHAIAYRLAGARDVRWEYSWRMAAVWVIAHRFVATTGPFVFVAIVPFVVINAALIAGALLVPELAVFLLFVLLWHVHGSIGDWSLLNFVWQHRARGFWTFDDADEARSYFFVRQ